MPGERSEKNCPIIKIVFKVILILVRLFSFENNKSSILTILEKLKLIYLNI